MILRKWGRIESAHDTRKEKGHPCFAPPVMTGRGRDHNSSDDEFVHGEIKTDERVMEDLARILGPVLRHEDSAARPDGSVTALFQRTNL